MQFCHLSALCSTVANIMQRCFWRGRQGLRYHLQAISRSARILRAVLTNISQACRSGAPCAHSASRGIFNVTEFMGTLLPGQTLCSLLCFPPSCLHGALLRLVLEGGKCNASCFDKELYKLSIIGLPDSQLSEPPQFVFARLSWSLACVHELSELCTQN